MDITFRFIAVRALLACALLLDSAFSSAGDLTLVPGTDLMGGDYKGFALAAPTPETCLQACSEDAKCLSYTYVKPGLKGPAAMCFLKNTVPVSTANDCCTSGKKTTAIKIAPKPPSKPAPAKSQTAGYVPIILTKTPDAGTKPLVFVQLPTGLVFTSKPDMTGWTPLTHGATAGGASVLQLANGEGRVVVRAADKKLYMAKMDLLNPGTIDSAAWVAMQGGLQPGAESEPHCQPNTSDAPKIDLGCVFHGKGGSVSLIMVTASGWNDTIETGGQNAGGRPTLLGFSHEVIPSNVRRVRFDALAWDGGLVAYRQMHASDHMPRLDVLGFEPSSIEPDWPVGWQKLASAMATPVGCSRLNLCAAGTLANKVAMFVVNAPPQLTVNMLEGKYVSPALPSGLSMDIAPAPVLLSEDKQVFARGKNGHIYRWRAQALPATWEDMGGDAKAGASINCRANNEQPMCFIQATDGKIYWRKFSSPAGL